MGRGRRSSRAVVLPVVAALLGGAAGVGGSPVPFHRPGEGATGEPAVGLGGPAPYLSVRPSVPAPPDTPPAPDPVYAATGPGMFAPNARGLPPRLYVAHGPVIDVLDPRTLRPVGRLRPGTAVPRVVPSWDLRRLWVVDRVNGVLLPVRPRGGSRGRAVRDPGPAGLYFTPDGRDALLLSRRPSRVDVRDPRTMATRGSVPLPCAAGHADFPPGGTSLVATCTAAGALVRVDLAGRRVAGTVRLPAGARPGDLRLSPDGAVLYVADAAKGGLWLVDAARFAVTGFVPTGPGARGLAVGRDARRLFVTGAGALTAVDFRTRRAVARRPLPGRRAPVPGGVSPDGTVLWLADPSGFVYAVSTRTGRVLRGTRVAGRPSGLHLHPQPGRFSLGGTGLYR